MHLKLPSKAHFSLSLKQSFEDLIFSRTLKATKEGLTSVSERLPFFHITYITKTFHAQEKNFHFQ